MILILTESRDLHADHATRRLRERGADFIRFHTDEFPTRAEVSLTYSATGLARHQLRSGDASVDLDDVHAVWYRRPRRPVPHDEITAEAGRESIADECQTFLEDVWGPLDACWVPARPATIRLAQLKASHLRVAGALGFELPPTLFTNSPDEFLEFYRQHNGRVVSKLAAFSMFREVGTPFGRYTEPVSTRDVGFVRAIRYCPMIFQAYVDKRLELRVTVVGNEVFAAEIHSQQTNHTRHDWRRYDRYAMRYQSHALPPDVAGRCVQLVQRLGLCYGAIDLILTPDGRYVFLEINPNGQYLWIELETGLPITDALCDLLITRSSGGHAEQNLEPRIGVIR